MYKPEPLTRRGSLRSLRSAPLLTTVLESTLSLTSIHPITSLELPGLDYAVQSQTALGAPHHREIGASLRSSIAAITAASAVGSTTVGQQSVVGTSATTAGLLGRLGHNASRRHTELKRNLQPKRALSRKFKPHIVADTVKQYINRAQRTTKGSSQQQPNMEFLRGVYAFMQVSRSSVEYNSVASNVNTIFIEAIPITTANTKTTPNNASTTTTTFCVHQQQQHLKDTKRTNVEKSSQRNQINKCVKTIQSKEAAQIMETKSKTTNKSKTITKNRNNILTRTLNCIKKQNLAK